LKKGEVKMQNLKDLGVTPKQKYILEFIQDFVSDCKNDKTIRNISMLMMDKLGISPYDFAKQLDTSPIGSLVNDSIYLTDQEVYERLRPEVKEKVGIRTIQDIRQEHGLVNLKSTRKQLKPAAIC